MEEREKKEDFIFAYKFIEVGSGVMVIFPFFDKSIVNMKKGIPLTYCISEGSKYLKVGDKYLIPLEKKFLECLERSENLYIARSEFFELNVENLCEIPLDRLFLGKLIAYCEIEEVKK